MDRELQHPLANLLAKTAEEWFRYYGTSETQTVEMRAVIERGLNQTGGAS